MKKVLLISYFYPPARSNETRRVQKLSKFLSKNNIMVDVIASKSTGLPMDDNLRFNDVDNERIKINWIKHKRITSKNKIFRIIIAILRLDWQFMYVFRVLAILFKNRKKLTEYEYIYCTIRPYSLLIIPIFIKIISNAKTLLDFRFIFYLESYFYKKYGVFNYLYIIFDKLLLKLALKCSDYRISLTDTMGNILLKETGYNFLKIEQGFDSDEKELTFSDEDKVEYYKNNFINIVYTGSIAPTQADPDEIVKLVTSMTNRNSNLFFHFFGLVGGLENKFKNCRNVEFYRYLNFKQFYYVVKSADILWMYYSNNKKNDFRIGTKTYDFINVGKPILCFCSINQETIKTLVNYPNKLIITEDYIKNSEKIDFIQLQNLNDKSKDDLDIKKLYYPFLEPNKYF